MPGISIRILNLARLHTSLLSLPHFRSLLIAQNVLIIGDDSCNFQTNELGVQFGGVGPRLLKFSACLSLQDSKERGSTRDSRLLRRHSMADLSEILKQDQSR